MVMKLPNTMTDQIKFQQIITDLFFFIEFIMTKQSNIIYY